MLTCFARLQAAPTVGNNAPAKSVKTHFGSPNVSRHRDRGPRMKPTRRPPSPTVTGRKVDLRCCQVPPNAVSALRLPSGP